jgi:hypothetical protein
MVLLDTWPPVTRHNLGPHLQPLAKRQPLVEILEKALRPRDSYEAVSTNLWERGLVGAERAYVYAIEKNKANSNPEAIGLSSSFARLQNVLVTKA